jgi:hypothetical protein
MNVNVNEMDFSSSEEGDRNMFHSNRDSQLPFFTSIRASGMKKSKT